MDRTIEYVKDRYNEEQARFKHVEDKCSKLLTFLTVIISVLAAIASIKNSSLFSPTQYMEWVLLGLFCLTIFCTFCAWGHALLALKVGKCPSIPVNSESSQYVKNADEADRDLYIFDCYVDTTQLLTIEIDKKIKNLELAYNELTLSAWGVAILSTLIIIKELIK